MAIRPKKQIDDPASMPSGANSGYKGSGATGTGGLGGSRVVSSRGAKGAKPSTGKAKVEKKLTQLDRRSKAVAPGKKYSDMTPAEKRKWDALNAEKTTRMTKKKG